MTTEHRQPAIADEIIFSGTERWPYPAFPLQTIDLAFVQWMETCDVPFTLIFTKVDKETPNRVNNHIALFKQHLGENNIAVPEILTSSIKTKFGRTQILTHIEKSLKTDWRAE